MDTATESAWFSTWTERLVVARAITTETKNSSYDWGTNRPYYGAGVFRCPAAGDARYDDETSPDTCGYGLNGFISDSSSSDPSRDERNRLWTRWSQIKRDKVVLVDGWHIINPSLPPPMEASTGIHLRHRGRQAACYLFSDFHAEASGSLHKWAYTQATMLPDSVGFVANNPASPWWPKK